MRPSLFARELPSFDLDQPQQWFAKGYASDEDIDKGMKLGCNHPIGPRVLADMIGVDVLLSVMQRAGVVHAFGTPLNH